MITRNIKTDFYQCVCTICRKSKYSYLRIKIILPSNKNVLGTYSSIDTFTLRYSYVIAARNSVVGCRRLKSTAIMGVVFRVRSNSRACKITARARSRLYGYTEGIYSTTATVVS